MKLSGELQMIRNAVVSAALKALKGNLTHVLAKGSSVKGEAADFIPGYSDIDIHLYVKPDALLDERSPKPEIAFLLQEEMNRIYGSMKLTSGCAIQLSGKYSGDRRRPVSYGNLGYGHVCG